MFSTWYLPFVYPKDVGILDILNTDMLVSYYKWPAGRVMVILNALSFFLSVFLWFLLRVCVSLADKYPQSEIKDKND